MAFYSSTMKAALLRALAFCIAVGAFRVSASTDTSVHSAPSWHPAPGQRVPYGAIRSQITVCRSLSRRQCVETRLQKLLKVFRTTFGHRFAGFSTPTLDGKFTLEESLPVIIFSYEPSGNHLPAVLLRSKVLPRFRGCRQT